MKWIVAQVVAFLCLSTTAWAQQATVRGQLVDAEGPVGFANVAVQGSKASTSTGMDGRFSLELKATGTYKLVVVGMGYARKEQSFTLSTFADMDLGTLTLVREMNALDDVVVTGTMKPMSRSESPVSVEVITPELFRKNPGPTLFEAVG